MFTLGLQQVAFTLSAMPSPAGCEPDCEPGRRRGAGCGAGVCCCENNKHNAVCQGRPSRQAADDRGAVTAARAAALRRRAYRPPPYTGTTLERYAARMTLVTSSTSASASKRGSRSSRSCGTWRVRRGLRSHDRRRLTAGARDARARAGGLWGGGRGKRARPLRHVVDEVADGNRVEGLEHVRVRRVVHDNRVLHVPPQARQVLRRGGGGEWAQRGSNARGARPAGAPPSGAGVWARKRAGRARAQERTGCAP